MHDTITSLEPHISRLLSWLWPLSVGCRTAHLYRISTLVLLILISFTARQSLILTLSWTLTPLANSLTPVILLHSWSVQFNIAFISHLESSPSRLIKLWPCCTRACPTLPSCFPLCSYSQAWWDVVPLCECLTTQITYCRVWYLKCNTSHNKSWAASSNFQLSGVTQI